MQNYFIYVFFLGLSACAAAPSKSPSTTTTSPQKNDCLSLNVLDCAIIHTPVKP